MLHSFHPYLDLDFNHPISYDHPIIYDHPISYDHPIISYECDDGVSFSEYFPLDIFNKWICNNRCSIVISYQLA